MLRIYLFLSVTLLQCMTQVSDPVANVSTNIMIFTVQPCLQAAVMQGHCVEIVQHQESKNTQQLKRLTKHTNLVK